MSQLTDKICKVLPDELYLQLKYFFVFHKFINFNNPKSFNEKIQYNKLYDRNPRYNVLCDKYEVKEYIKNNIGKEYIIPTIGVFEKFNDINIELLPKQFVIKCTHDSGSVCICKDINKFDINKARLSIEKSLNTNYYFHSREWAYKNIKPRIIIEEYVDNGENELVDYKLFCFNGEPKFCQVICDRSTEETIDFFDLEWNKQSFTGLNRPGKPYPHSKKVINKPKTLSKMIEIASLLSKDTSFVRVDFYEANGNMYFGEFTLYPASGFGCFEPDVWNDTFGEWINI